jgi:hypothetical protein
MTRSEYARLEQLARAYYLALARYRRTADQPHSLRHHAAYIAADNAATAYGAARMALHATAAR